MEGHVNLTGMAAVGLAALLCGMVMARLRQPALVGYILAGVLLGPSALGLVENRGQIAGLADLGVLLLLFLIGMELSVRVFMITWRLALSAVALQVAGSLAAIFLCSTFLGFTVAESVLLGFVIALSSTAVAIKMLEESGELRSRTGRIAVAILIGQDLAFLPMLLIVENIGGAGGIGIGAALQIAFAVGVIVLLVKWLNQRRVELPFAEIVIGHVDLSPLTGLVYCFGFGAFFGLLGLSPAYGAFLAGLVIGRSRQRETLISAVRPVQSILVMVFFLSIGLLIDLRFILDNLGTVLVLLLVVTLFKTALNIGIMRLLGETWQRAMLQGLTLSQIGEFSFLLAASGVAAGAIGGQQSRLVIAVTVLSIALSPLWLTSIRRIHGVASRRFDTLRELIDAAYGEDVRHVRRGSRRFGVVLRLMARGAWRRSVNLLPFLARIHEPHGVTAETKLLTPPAADTVTESAQATIPDAAPQADAPAQGAGEAATAAEPGPDETAPPNAGETTPAPAATDATAIDIPDAPADEAASGPPVVRVAEPVPESPEPKSAGTEGAGPEPGPSPPPERPADSPSSLARAMARSPDETLARLRALVEAAAEHPSTPQQAPASGDGDADYETGHESGHGAARDEDDRARRDGAPGRRADDA